MVAAPASGHGKTTVATGVMAALRRAGHRVSGHKVGPDYIDPGYHALATGRPGRNLDPHLVGERRLAPLLLHGAAGADVAVVEGVMGLYDGRLGGAGFASTAHVAAVTHTPVVLVVDVSHASRSVAATVHGMATWSRPPVRVAGVILNKAGSSRHAREVIDALGDSVPVLGVLQRDDGIEAPSRHLGLVPAAERPDAAGALDRLAEQTAANLDLPALVRIAQSAPDLADQPWSAAAAVARSAQRVGSSSGRNVGPDGGHDGRRARPVVAMAGGRAFTFCYTETEELLRAAGCEVVTVDPLRDERLPAGTSALYLGGGFPEMHASELAANATLRVDIARAVAAGMPTVAECAGLLYLCRRVYDAHGSAAEMAGVLDVDAAMTPRLTLGYRTARAPADNLLVQAGQQVTGHEFHRTALLHPIRSPRPHEAAWSWDARTEGLADATLHASYLHTHWAGSPALATRLAAAARGATRRAGPGPVTSRPALTQPGGETPPRRRTTVVPPALLRHHGDREVDDDLADFAVNVYDDTPPPWLAEALRDSLADLARYPDPAYAEHVLATRHGRDPGEVLATAGAAEAFGLLARVRPWRRPTVVHPQFTEPDVALAQAGHRPHHVVLTPDDGFRLDAAGVPEEADLVVVGNPTNPTGVLHPRAALLALLRPHRLVVVDEAFCDDAAASLADDPHPGLVVVRSLTKLWALPGLRIGYLLAAPDMVAALRRAQTPWSVSTPAAAAAVACCSAEATGEARRRTATINARRAHLVAGLQAAGVQTVQAHGSSAPFVLARPGAGVREALRERGFAVRRGDTFPGLGEDWVRIAARDEAATDALLGALHAIRSMTRPTDGVPAAGPR